ncbi:MAG: phage head-tail connector protein [Peptoniphilus sp.]|uniref:phage head-tail connector protein n=1 Tax=Peptoniphilus sp. TaxID=1971214 RepID=UPI002A757FCF|nr:phage head-tail connector protein [Peptoniphilus sp.]MDY2986130.1 phage head-tail connector protein [Peptoniphilus sp.]
MEALKLVKAQLGITINSRDEYLKAIIEGCKKELLNIQGIKIDETIPDDLMFLVDYSAWRYSSKDSDAGMPERIRWRLRNLFLKKAGE